MSRRKGANVVVTARQCRGNHEKMIRKFIKKCKKEKIIEGVRERRYFVKPSTKRRLAEKNRQQTLKKLRREQEK